MIARGSMVVLKGHHLTPMVVAFTANSDGRRRLPSEGHVPDDTARVMWLDTFGVPHAETYPLDLLEEIDG